MTLSDYVDTLLDRRTHVEREASACMSPVIHKPHTHTHIHTHFTRAHQTRRCMYVFLA
jgi:hypothetical protein